MADIEQRRIIYERAVKWAREHGVPTRDLNDFGSDATSLVSDLGEDYWKNGAVFEDAMNMLRDEYDTDVTSLKIPSSSNNVQSEPDIVPTVYSPRKIDLRAEHPSENDYRRKERIEALLSHFSMSQHEFLDTLLDLECIDEKDVIQIDTSDAAEGPADPAPKKGKRGAPQLYRWADRKAVFRMWVAGLTQNRIADLSPVELPSIFHKAIKSKKLADVYVLNMLEPVRDQIAAERDRRRAARTWRAALQRHVPLPVAALLELVSKKMSLKAIGCGAILAGALAIGTMDLVSDTPPPKLITSALVSDRSRLTALPGAQREDESEVDGSPSLGPKATLLGMAAEITVSLDTDLVELARSFESRLDVPMVPGDTSDEEIRIVVTRNDSGRGTIALAFVGSEPCAAIRLRARTLKERLVSTSNTRNFCIYREAKQFPFGTTYYTSKIDESESARFGVYFGGDAVRSNFDHGQFAVLPYPIKDTSISPQYLRTAVQSFADGDGDLVPDRVERSIGSKVDTRHSDDDGVEDGVEICVVFSDPLQSDSDRDGTGDGAELKVGRDPIVDDANLESAGPATRACDSLIPIYNVDPKPKKAPANGYSRRPLRRTDKPVFYALSSARVDVPGTTRMLSVIGFGLTEAYGKIHVAVPRDQLVDGARAGKAFESLGEWYAVAGPKRTGIPVARPTTFDSLTAYATEAGTVFPFASYARGTKGDRESYTQLVTSIDEHEAILEDGWDFVGVMGWAWKHGCEE